MKDLLEKQLNIIKNPGLHPEKETKICENDTSINALQSAENLIEVHNSNVNIIKKLLILRSWRTDIR